jgi:hypothetical protein
VHIILRDSFPPRLGCIRKQCKMSSVLSPYTSEPRSAQNIIIFIYHCDAIPIFRLGCIREHCIISSVFPLYVSEPNLCYNHECS